MRVALRGTSTERGLWTMDCTMVWTLDSLVDSRISITRSQRSHTN